MGKPESTKLRLADSHLFMTDAVFTTFFENNC